MKQSIIPILLVGILSQNVAHAQSTSQKTNSSQPEKIEQVYIVYCTAINSTFVPITTTYMEQYLRQGAKTKISISNGPYTPLIYIHKLDNHLLLQPLYDSLDALPRSTIFNTQQVMLLVEGNTPNREIFVDVMGTILYHGNRYRMSATNFKLLKSNLNGFFNLPTISHDSRK